MYKIMLKQTKAFDVAAFKVGGHITINYVHHSELLRALITKAQEARLTVYLYYDGKFRHLVIKASDTTDAEEIDGHPWITTNKLTAATYADFLEAY